MARNRRKHARNFTYDPRDSIVHGSLVNRVTVHLTDPDEQDRQIFLNLTSEDAHLLAWRLLHHVAAIEADHQTKVS